MIVGLDIRMLGKKHGGIGRYTFELTKHVLETNGRHQYLLFYNEYDAKQEDLELFRAHKNATLVPVNARHYSLAEQTTFLRQLMKHRMDVMHFLNFNVPLLYRHPFVVTIHDVIHHKLSRAKKSNSLHSYAYRKVIQNAADKSRTIITVSQYSKDDIAETLRVDPNKIEVTYAGRSVMLDVEQTYVDQVKQRYNLQRPYLLFVGVLEHKKNIINLTRGFDAYLKKYNADLDLVLIGRPDKHYPEIQQQAMDIEHKDHLIFTGYVEDRDLVALYKGAYAYANASIHEGFGLPGVEAMQFGLPLLVSDTPVFHEIYDGSAVYFDGQNVNDIADKIHALQQDPALYQQRRAVSLERAQKFDWRNTAQQTLRILERSVGTATLNAEPVTA